MTDIDPQTLADINREVIRDLRRLHGMRQSDEFDVESARIIDDLQERGLTLQADIVTEYVAKDPGSLSTQEAIAARSAAQEAIGQITEAAFAAQQEQAALTAGAAEEVDPQARKATMQDVSDQISEGLAGIQEVLKGVTPEYLSQKFDEEMSSPEAIALMKEKGINPQDVVDKKDVLIDKLHSEIQSLSESEQLTGSFEKNIEEAVENLPDMVDSAVKKTVDDAMNGLDERISDAFNANAKALDDALNYNHPSIDEAAKEDLDPKVLQLVNSFINLKETQPEQYEQMKETFGQASPEAAEAFKFIDSMEQSAPVEAAPSNDGGGMRP